MITKTKTFESTDSVQVARYQYLPDPDSSGGGQSGATLLFSHATGFHGRCFDTTIAALVDEFPCYSFDYRGHGDSPIDQSWQVDWAGYGQDACTIASSIENNGPLIGIGHSMGGACLIMAALEHPQLFRALIVYEPIVFPMKFREPDENKPVPLVEGAKRRRKVFASRQDAYANYSSKPPLNGLDPRVLQSYVEFGFADSSEGAVLKCAPELEGRTYEMGGMHRTFERLTQLPVPTWVLTGEVEPNQPSSIGQVIAEQIPTSSLFQWADVGHFGPMQLPLRLAEFVRMVSGLV